MEFRDDFKIQGQWIPATPVKPIPEKRPPSTISPASLLESVGRASGGRSDGELRGMALDREMLAQMPYTQLFEAAEAGTVSSMNFSPQMTAQNVELNAAASNWDHSLLKGRTFLPPLPPKSHFITEAMAPLATPATMEKNQHGSLHDLLAHEFIDLVSDTVSYRDAQQQYEPSKLQLSIEENHKDHSFSLQPTEGLRIMGDDSFEGITARQAEGENQVIDSNSTPQQKPKRKKHRPKVLKEGNPARTSKPRTPKAPQTASVKRKYVRKKKDPNLQETATCMHGEIVNQEGQRKKPVRRCLNFDLEESEELDRWAGSLPVMCRHNLTETQAQGAHAGDVNCSEGSSVAQLVSGDVGVPHTPCKPPQPSRLEAMRGKLQDDFARMLSKLSPSPETKRRKGENLKKLARKNVCLDIAGESERNLVGRYNEVDSAAISDVFLKTTEGDHNLIDRAYTEQDRMSGNNNTSSAELSVDGIHKKRRILSDESAGYSTDAQCSMANEKRQALERMLMSNQAEREKANRLQAHSMLSWRADHHKVSSQLTHTRTSKDNQKECRQPSTPEKAPKTKKCEENATNGPRDRLDVMTSTPAKPRGRRPRKKEGIALVSSTASNACQTEPVAAASGTGFSLATESAMRIFNEKIASMQTSLVQGGSPSPAFLSGDSVTYREQVDALAQKLEHLKIDGGHQDVTCQLQNAVVPYVGAGGMIVSFQGSPDVIKKRKPRAKVDLDPESNRVWNLLMGKDSTEGEEGSEVDKEKWWEEERRVFRGRVDSFIARMHLIQGDRRFSRWKGSVVDSVIGVFLTQNVSDHLSSSAFMCLAARYPLQSNGNNNNPSAETISRSITVDDSTSLQVKSSEQEFCIQSALGINETEEKNNKEVASSNESLESNYSLSACHEEGLVDYLKENSSDFSQRELGIGNESPSSASGTAVTVTSCTSVTAEDVVSSQNSVVSSQNSSEYPNRTIYQDGLSPLLNVEADKLLGGGMSNGSNTFMELLQMAGNGKITSVEYGSLIRKTAAVPTGPAFVNCLGTSGYSSNSKIHLKQHDFMGLSCSPSHCDKDFSNSRFMGLENSVNEGYQSSSPFSSLEKNEKNINQMTGRLNHPSANSSTDGTHHNNLSACKFSWFAGSQSLTRNNSTQTVTSLGNQVCIDGHSYQSEVSSDKVYFNNYGYQQDRNAGVFPQGTTETELQVDSTQKQVRRQDEILNCYPATCSAAHIDHQRKDLLSAEAAESNLRNEAHTSQKASTERLKNSSKTRALKSENEKSYDWDSLRKQACHNSVKRERSKDTMDSLDYEALRRADVNEIAHTIRERGMNNRLAERIKDFLDRVVTDHGSIDLEWLRDAPPDKVKDYLLSIRGLGLKSVECVRLLTLHHLAFPVDTNVGRICVRLGWVPLQPLPESLQLHLLEMYPVQETIQKYLWPRLCKLDQLTLYELHYQLITFGKVFCTKSKPNCNACPMRGECKHFASAFASARLALPGPEEKSLVTSENHNPIPGAALFQNQTPIPRLEGCTSIHERQLPRSCEPIIEEPATPEPEPEPEPETECTETSEIDIEDAFYNDPDEIPTIKLNFEEFTHNLHNYIQRNGVGLEDGDMSKALVAITPEAASIPMPKLKNVNRLRTEHLVYELPDSHPLLDGMDKREPDDPCPYLLAIWTPGETPQSTEPPSACCNSQDTGTLCDRSTCFSCNSIREAQTQIVRGTLLIPCRTANRGSFPLNGTYFQVNEVFADHFSSCSPIDVPRNWIWNLPRRTVYFGTSIPSIFKGLTTEGIQLCFWRGFVCVRGFDRMTRAPKPLFARLHFPASKATRNRRTGSTAAARGNDQR